MSAIEWPISEEIERIEVDLGKEENRESPSGSLSLNVTNRSPRYCSFNSSSAYREKDEFWKARPRFVNIPRRSTGSSSGFQKLESDE